MASKVHFQGYCSTRKSDRGSVHDEFVIDRRDMLDALSLVSLLLQRLSTASAAMAGQLYRLWIRDQG
jgi:hypothetical protein